MGRRQEGVEDGDEGKNQPGYSHSDVTSCQQGLCERHTCHVLRFSP